MVYEWLCGAPPFQGTALELAGQHLHLPPPPLRERVPDLAAAVEQVLLQGLAKEPAERFPSVKAFAIALQQAATSGSPSQPASSPLSTTSPGGSSPDQTHQLVEDLLRQSPDDLGQRRFDQALAYLKRGDLYSMQGDLSRAFADLEQALRLDATNESIRSGLERVRRALKQRGR
jgi:tetratricopeptide (TPR) repeat protein